MAAEICPTTDGGLANRYVNRNFQTLPFRLVAFGWIKPKFHYADFATKFATNKNNKMPAKDRKAPEGTLTSTLNNTI